MSKKRWTPHAIKSLREALGETQAEFCQHFRIGLGTLRHWEQGHGEPSGSSTVVLDLLALAADGIEPPADLRPLVMMLVPQGAGV